MYSLSKKSLSKLAGCHLDLQKLMQEAIKASPYDFGIIWGYRSPVKQNELYQQGRITEGKIVTYIDGHKNKSKHNYKPSQAVDIACYVNGNLTWNAEIYKIVASHILDIAENLFLKGEIENRITWGGHWHKLKDWPHFQI